VPSEYLAGLARRWADPARVVVVPNPAPEVTPNAEAVEQGLFVFAGRLTRQKALATAIDAVARVPGARLAIIGDGADRGSLERQAAKLDGRIDFRGPLTREETLRAMAGATAALLSSDWENLPHAAVEALALGVPVVATAVGGVPEVVHDGVNGLLVPPGRPEELARALARILEEPGLRERLAAAAAPSVAALSRDATFGRLEQILLEAQHA
jgi:glycosyltransferase involved in cell wall biosynthesis